MNKSSFDRQLISKKQWFLMHTTHLGKVFSNLSIFSFALTIIGLLSVVAAVGYMLLLIAAVIFTLGLILFMLDISNKADNMETIVQYGMTLVTISAPICLFCSILSLIFLCLDKKNLSIPRIVFDCIAIAACIIGGIVYAVVTTRG